MNFAWNQSQQELYDRIVGFARECLGNDQVVVREREHRFAADAWRLCGDFGLLGLSVPEKYQGLGLDALSTAYAMEAFGFGCEDMGLVFSAAAHLFACAMPISVHGSEAVKERFVSALAQGRMIGANAITESEAGSDAFAMQTSATRDGDEYVLNGHKSYVTNGPVADVFLVYAMSNPDHGYLGISAFVVAKDTPGLRVGEPMRKLGLATSPTASIYLDDCRVPASCRVGAEGGGASIFQASMRWERACLFAGYLGAMERQLAQAIDYGKTRQQFGKSIARYQAISHRIVDMKLRLESARLLLYRACWRSDRENNADIDISLAKLAVSEAAVESALDIIRIHGGNGVISEMGIDRGLRDAVPAILFSGTSEIQRNVIANHLGL